MVLIKFGLAEVICGTVSMQERAGVADSDEIVDGAMSLSEPIMAIPSYFSRLGYTLHFFKRFS